MVVVHVWDDEESIDGIAMGSGGGGLLKVKL